MRLRAESVAAAEISPITTCGGYHKKVERRKLCLVIFFATYSCEKSVGLAGVTALVTSFAPSAALSNNHAHICTTGTNANA